MSNQNIPENLIPRIDQLSDWGKRPSQNGCVQKHQLLTALFAHYLYLYELTALNEHSISEWVTCVDQDQTAQP